MSSNNNRNNECIISNLAFNPLLNKLLEEKLRFQGISYEHIYREYNVKTNVLSLEALPKRRRARHPRIQRQGDNGQSSSYASIKISV